MQYTKEELNEIYRISKEEYKIQQKDEEWLKLMDILNERGPFDNILEIGCYSGGSTHSLSHFTKKMITLDWNNPARFDITKFNYLNYNYIGGDSHNENNIKQAKDFLNNESIHLFFCDGDHSYAGVKADFENFKDLYKKDYTIVVFHDIYDSQYHRSAGCFVHDFWNEIKLEYKHIELKYENNIWGGIGILFI